MPTEINGVLVLTKEETALYDARRNIAAHGLSPELCFRLAGLSDGEACFSISRQTKGGSYICEFIIKLRADDHAVLKRLHDETQLGVVRIEAGYDNRAPQVRWTVARKAECQLLADVFRAFPLWSKKQRDCEIWCRAVDLWVLTQPGERTSWELIGEMCAELKALRRYPKAEDGSTIPNADKFGSKT